MCDEMTRERRACERRTQHSIGQRRPLDYRQRACPLGPNPITALPHSARLVHRASNPRRLAGAPAYAARRHERCAHRSLSSVRPQVAKVRAPDSPERAAPPEEPPPHGAAIAAPPAGPASAAARPAAAAAAQEPVAAAAEQTAAEWAAAEWAPAEPGAVAEAVAAAAEAAGEADAAAEEAAAGVERAAAEAAAVVDLCFSVLVLAGWSAVTVRMLPALSTPNKVQALACILAGERLAIAGRRPSAAALQRFWLLKTAPNCWPLHAPPPTHRAACRPFTRPPKNNNSPAGGRRVAAGGASQLLAPPRARPGRPASHPFCAQLHLESRCLGLHGGLALLRAESCRSSEHAARALRAPATATPTRRRPGPRAGAGTRGHRPAVLAAQRRQRVCRWVLVALPCRRSLHICPGMHVPRPIGAACMRPAPPWPRRHRHGAPHARRPLVWRLPLRVHVPVQTFNLCLVCLMGPAVHCQTLVSELLPASEAGAVPPPGPLNPPLPALPCPPHRSCAERR